MDPIGHDLEVTWEIDGVEVPTLAGKKSVAIDALGLATGVYSIEVIVVDRTDMVRNERLRESRMTDRRSWTIEAGCILLADLNGDGILDTGDIGTFVDMFLGNQREADMNQDGIVDNGDITTFVDLFVNPCP